MFYYWKLCQCHAEGRNQQPSRTCSPARAKDSRGRTFSSGRTCDRYLPQYFWENMHLSNPGDASGSQEMLRDWWRHPAERGDSVLHPGGFSHPNWGEGKTTLSTFEEHEEAGARSSSDRQDTEQDWEDTAVILNLFNFTSSWHQNSFLNK